MLEVIGYLVACKGNEGVVARAVIGTPITIVYARENFTNFAAEEAAVVIPGLAFD
ncbi:MAG TPA: hypothetical protein VIY51_28345 [Xanthobacteraceae bacterium]